MPDDKLRITCPYEDCRQRFKLGANLAGKKVKCANCRRRFLTPAVAGAPALKVPDTETSMGALEPITKATGALEPATKVTSTLKPKKGAHKQATSALEPISGSAPAKPAMADDMGLSLDTSAPAGRGPQFPLDDDMSLAGIDVSKPKTTFPADPGFADPITSAEKAADDMSLGFAESPQASSASSLDDDMLAGIDFTKPKTTSATAGIPLQSVDDMEMGLDTSASTSPSTGAQPVQFSDEEPETRSCPKCHGPVVSTFQRCPTCGTKVGGGARSKVEKGPKRKLPIFKVAAVLMLGTFLYGGYWFWDRTRLVGVGGAIREGAALTKGVLTKVMSKESAEKALGAVQKTISQDRIVVAAEDELEIEDANKKVKVRQGQPLIQKQVTEGRAKVILKTPNGDVVGWVPEAKVTEVTNFDRSDLLGINDKQPTNHTGPVADLVFKNDGRFLSSIASSGAVVNVWQASKSRLIRSYQGHQSKVVGAAFLQDGAIVSNEGEAGARVWDPLTTATLRKLPDFKGFFRTIGNNHCIEVHGGNIRIWDLKQGRMETSKAVALETGTIRISQDGRILLARNAEGKFLSFNLPGLEAAGDFAPPFEHSGYDLSPDGSLVAIVPAQPSRIVLVDSKSGKEKAGFSYNGAGSARFCGSSGYLAVADAGGKKVEILQISKVLGLEIKQIINSKDGAQITTIASAPSGKMLGVGHSDGSVQIYALDFIKTSTGSSGSTAVAATKEEKTALRDYNFLKQFILNKKPEEAKMYYKRLVAANPDSPLAVKAKEEMTAAGIDVD